MTNISLSIIIVNYNTFKLTRDTINSCISEPTRYTYEIFLVDNKSTDDSLFQLKEYFKKEISRGTIKVIENEENKGFANANNLAIEKSQGDFVLLLNSDTLVEQNTIDKCMDYMTSAVNADVGALGCKVSLADGSLDKACKRSFPNPANSFYKLFNINTGSSKADYNLTGLDDNGVYEIDCLTGAFMLVRNKKTKRRNPKLVYEFYRAMYVFYRKHYTKKYNFLLNIAVYIGIFVLLVKNLLANELKRF